VNVESERAGRCVAVDGGNPWEYHAFVPHALPPAAPELHCADELLGWDRRALLALGRLDGMAKLLPNPDLFLYMHVRKEAVLSSQIEGTQSSLSDLLMHEDAATPSVPLADVEEVSRYVAAANRGQLLLQKLPLSSRLLTEVHATLLTGARGSDKTPGELRRSQNWIGGSGPSNALFVPPPVDEVAACMHALELFVHAETPQFSAIVKAALVHAQFETIHPFLDGNGRLGRLLISLSLMHDAIIHAPVFYPSLYFKQHRTAYYEHLQRVRTHGEWEPWVLFFVRGIALSAEAAEAALTAVHQLFMRDRAKIEALPDRNVANVLRAFDYARHKAVLSVGPASQAMRVTAPTVAAAIAPLLALNILREATGKQRDRRYVYTEYIQLLSDERPLA
jgi:Fic family protein